MAARTSIAFGVLSAGALSTFLRLTADGVVGIEEDDCCDEGGGEEDGGT